jgi:methionyl-tRNA formyltransferase
MRIVFFGTGAFATPAFEALAKSGHKVVALVTEPGAHGGEGGPEVPAGAWRIPVMDPVDPGAPETEEALRQLSPDVQVLVGYAPSLPVGLLKLAPSGTVKVHPSLLPRYRGPAPIAWAILNGEERTGVTTLLMDGGLDTGPVFLKKTTEIGPEETSGELAARLAKLGAEALVETLNSLGDEAFKPTAQSSRPSGAPPVGEDMAEIDWSSPADVLARRVRALNPAPVAETQLQGKRLKVLRASPAGEGKGEPGEVLATGFDGIVVACGGGTALRLTQVQLDDLRPMSPSALVSRLRLARGARFGRQAPEGAQVEQG